MRLREVKYVSVDGQMMEATKLHSGSTIDNCMIVTYTIVTVGSLYLVSEANGRVSYAVAKRAANMGASIIQTIHRTQERAQERRRSRKEICYGNEIISLFNIIHREETATSQLTFFIF